MKSLTFLITLSLNGLLAAPALADVEDEINRTFEIGNQGTIRLSNTNGNVTVRACDCDTVTVKAVIEASSQKARDKIEVKMKVSGEQLTIKTHHHENYFYNKERSKVTYTLDVPNATHLKNFELVNGSLDIKAVEGTLDVSLVNGRLTTSGLTSDVEASTVNGKMELRFADLSQVDDIDLSSVNGKVNLYLPSNASAKISASTVNGGISNDFGLEVIKNKYVGSSMQGTLGNGSTEIDLETVNGKINIDKH